MIARESGDGLSADMVEAAVAHMGEMELPAYNGHRGACGPHSVELRVLHRITLNRLVSRFQGLQQRALRIRAEGILVDVTHGLDCEAAGFLSAFVPSHAVGDYGQAAFAEEFLIGLRLPVEVRILIIAALAANVGQARGLDSGLWSFAVDCHNWKSTSEFRWNVATNFGSRNLGTTRNRFGLRPLYREGRRLHLPRGLPSQR